MRNRRMNQLDDCLQRTIGGQIDEALQNEVADKILELLEQEKASLGKREKTLFVQAIRALSASINSSYRSGETGLRRCLMALRSAMAPEYEPYDSNALTDDESVEISYDMLVTTVKMIKGQIV